MKGLIFIFTMIFSSVLIAEECSDEMKNEKLKELMKINQKLTSDSNYIPLNNIDSELDVQPYSQKYLGFSYFIGKGNERFEKLEGYEDIYLMIDHYDPTKHQLNTLFFGSHAVVKYDRSVNPPNVIYLSKQKHIAGKSPEEMRNYKSVNETLCSLNTECSQKLVNFNKIVDSSEFNSKVVPEYKNAIIDRLNDRLIIDTYHKKPEIQDKIKGVIELVKSKNFNDIDQVNTFIQQELTKITDSKLQKRTAQQYKEYIKKSKPNEDWLEYYDYSAILSNVLPDLGTNSFVHKKKAIFEYCQKGTSVSCSDVKNLQKDLNYFDSKRVEIPDFP